MASQNGETSADVQRLLEEHPWEPTTALLLRHAQNKIRRLKWRGSWGGDLPGGAQAHDIVQNVYEKVLAGTRKWDPAKHPDFFEYLRDQVDSEISNLVTSSENKRVRPEGAFPTSVLERANGLSPEEIILAEERKRESDEFVFGFLEFLQGEPELQQVVDVLVGGSLKRAEIAEQLQISVEQVDSRRKKLKRRLEEYQLRRAASSASARGGTPNGRS